MSAWPRGIHSRIGGGGCSAIAVVGRITTSAVAGSAVLTSRWPRGLCTSAPQQPSPLASLPRPLLRRVAAIDTLQKEYAAVEQEFLRRQRILETQLRSRVDALLVRRQAIVSGEVEPSSESVDASDIAALLAGSADGVDEASGSDTMPSAQDSTAGIPGFWEMAMRQCTALEMENGSHACTPQDWQVLEHLVEIQLSTWVPPAHTDGIDDGDGDDDDDPAPTEDSPTASTAEEEVGFVLRFRFAPNRFLDHEVVPTLYCYAHGEVAEVVPPAWAPGADPSVTMRRKKVKRKGRPAEIVEEAKPKHSFFRIFAQPSADDEEADEAEGMPSVSEMQEGLVLLLAEELVPNASAYYLQALMQPERESSMSDDVDEADEEWRDVKPGAHANITRSRRR